MKGIVLAAGKGTRLYPMTLPVCKPLLPVYDKPLIYYSITTLVEAGIRDILIIIPPNEEGTFRSLLGDGSTFGLRIQYAQQDVPRGIADALLIGKEFVGQDDVCLVLGDNIFYGTNFSHYLQEVKQRKEGATVFGYYVDDPRPFGVVEFDQNGKAISIEEKPQNPKSNYVIPGLYFYDQEVMEIVSKLKPSARGELEITDVNKAYLEREKLHVIPLEKNFTWLDAGTADSLLHASLVVKTLQEESGGYVGCIEATAFQAGYLSKDDVDACGKLLGMTPYGQYLTSLL